MAAEVRAAAAGDATAWRSLVDNFTPMMWSIARSAGLVTGEAHDVVQVAWLRLVQHIENIREPERIGGWLATTVRRESWQLARRRRAEESVTDESLERLGPVSDTTPELEFVRAELHARLRWAILQLPPRQQLLVRLLAASTPPSYGEISAATGIPIGSIGPTRARALARLRQLLATGDETGEDLD